MTVWENSMIHLFVGTIDNFVFQTIAISIYLLEIKFKQQYMLKTNGEMYETVYLDWVPHMNKCWTN